MLMSIRVRVEGWARQERHTCVQGLQGVPTSEVHDKQFPKRLVLNVPFDVNLAVEAFACSSASIKHMQEWVSSIGLRHDVCHAPVPVPFAPL